jgi:hypothetical protein
MKDNKHIKSFNEATENLNISDVIKRIPDEVWKEFYEDSFTDGYNDCANKQGYGDRPISGYHKILQRIREKYVL